MELYVNFSDAYVDFPLKDVASAVLDEVDLDEVAARVQDNLSMDDIAETAVDAVRRSLDVEQLATDVADSLAPRLDSQIEQTVQSTVEGSIDIDDIVDQVQQNIDLDSYVDDLVQQALSDFDPTDSFRFNDVVEDLARDQAEDVLNDYTRQQEAWEQEISNRLAETEGVNDDAFNRIGAVEARVSALGEEVAELQGVRFDLATQITYLATQVSDLHNTVAFLQECLTRAGNALTEPQHPDVSYDGKAVVCQNSEPLGWSENSISKVAENGDPWAPLAEGGRWTEDPLFQLVDEHVD